MMNFVVLMMKMKIIMFEVIRLTMMTEKNLMSVVKILKMIIIMMNIVVMMMKMKIIMFEEIRLTMMTEKNMMSVLKILKTIIIMIEYECE
jgi:hypothetical protein